MKKLIVLLVILAIFVPRFFTASAVTAKIPKKINIGLEIQQGTIALNTPMSIQKTVQLPENHVTNIGNTTEKITFSGKGFSVSPKMLTLKPKQTGVFTVTINTGLRTGKQQVDVYAKATSSENINSMQITEKINFKVQKTNPFLLFWKRNVYLILHIVYFLIGGTVVWLFGFLFGKRKK